MKKNYIYILFILLLTQNIFPAIKTQNFLDKKKVYLGDIVKYNIIIEYDGNIEVPNFDIYTVLKDTSGVENFVVYNSQLKKIKKKKSLSLRYTFDLIPLKLGNVSINELKLKYVNKDTNEENILIIPSVEIEVQPYPKPKNKKFDGDIIDIKDQIWIRNYFLIFLLIIVVIGIVGYIFYKQNKLHTQSVTIQQQEIDIKEAALQKLEQLWNKNYVDNGLIKEFYLELTEIVRWYIGEKYKINALELTTEELFVALKNKVDKKYNLKLKSFLDKADLAKFAKYVPDRSEINQDFEIAKELVI